MNLLPTISLFPVFAQLFDCRVDLCCVWPLLKEHTGQCHRHLWETGVSCSLPELWSEEEVTGDLGSGLNMLASGLIWAFSGGAGGGTVDSMLCWRDSR